VPSYKYGGRQFQIQSNLVTASTTANATVGVFNYLPAVLANQAIDYAAETIKSATLVFVSSLASSATTGNSVIIAATQYNSAGSSVASAALYNQGLASVAALTPLDVSTKLNTWVLNPGDSVVLMVNTNTVGIPASFPNFTLSGTIDSVTAA